MNGDKGNSFNGFFSGERYESGVSLFGMGKAFYRSAVNGLGLTFGMKALDLGCGTGRLSFALAEISSTESEFFRC